MEGALPQTVTHFIKLLNRAACDTAAHIPPLKMYKLYKKFICGNQNFYAVRQTSFTAAYAAADKQKNMRLPVFFITLSRPAASPVRGRGKTYNLQTKLYHDFF